MLSQMIHEESIRTNHVLFFNIQHAAEQVIARWIVNRYKTPFNAWREAVGLAAVEEEIIDWKVKLAPMKRKYTIEELNKSAAALPLVVFSVLSDFHDEAREAAGELW